MKIFKKIIKITLASILVICLLLVSVPLLFKNKIKIKVLETIDQNINAKVNFSDIGFSTFKNFPRFTVTLRDACVTGVDDFEGDTLISAKEIGVSFNVYKLIKGNNLDIHSIRLDEPFIYARVLANGKANYNIVKPDTSHSTKNKVQIGIDKWAIHNGRIIYDDKLQKTYLEVGGLNHNGKGDFKQEISDLNIITQVSELTLIYGGVKYLNKKAFDADLILEMNFKEKKFTFKDHSFQLGTFKLGFSGFFKLLETGYQTDITFEVKETSFKNLLSLLPGIYQKDMAGITTKGEFACAGFVKGIYDAKTHKVPTFHIDLKVEDASFKYSHLPKAIENINFQLIADNPDGISGHGTFNLKTFHIEIDKKPIHGSIFINRQNGLYVKADIKLKTDLAELENIYPVKDLVLKGVLSSEIKMDGNYSDSLKLFPKVDAFLLLENGYVKSKESPIALDSIHLDSEVSNGTGQIADTRISLNKITFLLDSEPFTMSGIISNLKDYDYKLKMVGLLDLGKLTHIYPVPNTSLRGTLDFNYTTEGSLSKLEAKQYDQLKTEGTLEVKNLSYKSTDVKFPIHLDDAFFKFTPDKIVLKRFTAEFGKSNVTLKGHLRNYIPWLLKHDTPINGDLTMTCDTIDLNQWFPQSVAAPPDASVIGASTSSSPTNASGKTPKADSAAIKAKARQMQVLVIPKNLNFIIHSDFGLVNFGKMEIVNLTGGLKIANGILTLDETGFNSMDSKFLLSGDYNTTDIKHPTFDLAIGIEKLDINKAYQMFINDKATAPAKGNFSTNYNLKGDLNPDFTPIYSSLIGGGKIIIDSVSMKGMKLMNHVNKVSKKTEFKDPDLTDIVMETEIKGGKVFIKPFTFKVSKYLTEVEGWQSFDDKMEYLIKMSVPPFNRIKIPISIMGTSDKPVIKMGNDFKDGDFEKL
jgi:hypothetical protein